jgi:hypothetical protein
VVPAVDDRPVLAVHVARLPERHARAVLHHTGARRPLPFTARSTSTAPPTPGNARPRAEQPITTYCCDTYNNRQLQEILQLLPQDANGNTCR